MSERRAWKALEENLEKWLEAVEPNSEIGEAKKMGACGGLASRVGSDVCVTCCLLKADGCISVFIEWLEGRRRMEG